MIYALFLLSIAPFLFCAAFVSHIKYFHDPETDFKVSDLSFSPKKLGLFFSKTPNWVLHNSAFAFHLRAAEIGVYLLGPFVVTTGFYAFMQLYLNAVDNVDLQESTIYQLHHAIVALKARIDQLLFLRIWLLPLGIASLVLSLAFPLVYNLHLSKRLSKLQAGIFRTYYFFTVGTMFTFFGANEVARENNKIGDLAVQLNQIRDNSQKIHREAKKIFAKDAAKSVGQAPELENIYKQVNDLKEKVNQKKPEGVDQAREKAANQYNAVLASLPSPATWADILHNGINLENIDPDHINVTPPSNPKPPSGGAGGSGAPSENPQPENVNKPNAANTGKATISEATIGERTAAQPTAEPEKVPSDPTPDAVPDESPAPDDNLKVQDERPIASEFKHETYFLPDKNSPEAGISEKTSEKILDDLVQESKALDVELSASESIALSATKKIANALVFDMFHQIKATVMADPVLNGIADVLYLKALKPQLDQFVQDVFKGGIKMARSNLEGSESDKSKSVASKLNENQDLKDLRARMAAAEKTTAEAELKYAETMIKIRQDEKIEAERIAALEREGRIKLAKQQFFSSKWERIRAKYISDFMDGKIVYMLYITQPQKKERTMNAIKRWLKYRDHFFETRGEEVLNYRNVEDVFWNYAKNNLEVVIVQQLALYHAGICKNPFDLSELEFYANDNYYGNDLIANIREIADHLNDQICYKTK